MLSNNMLMPYRQLLRGTAEVAGTELAKARPYKIAGGSTAIFSWHGCTLEISFHATLIFCICYARLNACLLVP